MNDDDKLKVGQKRVEKATAIALGRIEKATAIAVDGLITDGGHHKQWYLEQILIALGVNMDELRDTLDWDEGIAP